MTARTPRERSNLTRLEAATVQAGKPDPARTVTAKPGAARPTAAKVDAKALKQRLQQVSGVKRGPTPADEMPAIVADNGRKGRRSIAVYMQPIAKAQLDRIAHEHHKSIQALGIEAINLLFRHYDQKPIA